MTSPVQNDIRPAAGPKKKHVETTGTFYYRFCFRLDGREFTASSTGEEYRRESRVMIKVEHGYEPAIITGKAAGKGEEEHRPVNYHIVRALTEEEAERYQVLPGLEKDAYAYCRKQVDKLQLPMDLVRVEQFFNGSKIIFYFTADNRVDFRELVKILVQRFRTRVEMRQIGVRHETQMIGGLGACGRELCCSAFLNKFESVSIKMAKTQDLPLNPAKISGLCNRLLCCLTYEYDTYRLMKKGMPRTGKSFRFEDKVYRVIRQIPLSGTLVAISQKGEERVFLEQEWRKAEVIQKTQQGKKGGGKKK